LNTLRNTRTYSWLALTLSLAIASVSSDAVAANHLPTLSKQCGQATATIACTAFSSDSSCASTTLGMKTSKSQEIDSPKPKGLEKYSAIGLQCVKSKKGSAYFYVEYGDLPWRCRDCEWFAIYDDHGSLLTNNDPPMLPAKDLPSDQPYEYGPNNNEFHAKAKRLGLPEINIYPIY